MLSPDKIGHQIRSIRESKGYSQEYMANMLQCSQSAYASLEAGKTSVRMERLFNVLEVLETDFETFMEIKKENQPSSHVSESSENVEWKAAYDQLISEMKEEIIFQRNLITTKNQV